VDLVDEFDNVITSVNLSCSRGKATSTWDINATCTAGAVGCRTRLSWITVTTTVPAAYFVTDSDVFNDPTAAPAPTCAPQLLFSAPSTISCGFVKPKQRLTVHID
jgi:hypothetical protein